MVAVAIPGRHGLPKLDAGAVEGHDGVPRVIDAAPHVGRHHLVVHVQRGEEDVPVSIHLHGDQKRHLKSERGGKMLSSIPPKSP